MSYVRAIMMEPGKEAEGVEIDVTKQGLMELFGGKYRFDTPRNNGVAILYKQLEEDEVLRANRHAVNNYGYEGSIYCGVIFAVGCDLNTSRFRSLTDAEFIQVMRDYKEPHYRDYPDYGLEPEEEILILHGKKLLFQQRAPVKVEVVKEYPYYILLKGFFVHLSELRPYPFTIHKTSLISGEVKAKRKRGGELR